MSGTLMLTLVLVPALRLLAGRVNVHRRRAAYRLYIAEEGVDPAIADPLLRELRGVLAASPAPGTAVGVHLERGMAAGEVRAADGPHLVSVYLPAGAMPQATADDLAAAIAHIIRA